jgi:hypothetical protein
MNSFNDYIDELVKQQHKILEQSSDAITIHRSQGAIATLNKLKSLRDEVNGIKVNKWKCFKMVVSKMRVA